MPFLSHKNKTQVVFVPVAENDTRAYCEKWNDKNYLRQIVGFENNEILRGELLRALTEVRDAADRATSPEELKGCQIGIAQLKKLLTLPAMAKALLKQMEKPDAKTEYEYLQTR